MLKRITVLALCVVFCSAAVSAQQMTEHRIEDIGASVKMPEEWILFTPDTQDDDPNLALLGLNGKELRESFTKNGIRLNSLPQDMSAEITVSCASDTKTRAVFDYNRTGAEAIEKQMQAIIDKDLSKTAPGLTYHSYEQYDVNGMIFFRLLATIEREDAPASFVQYNTVFNGYSVNIAYHSFDGDVSEEGELLLRQVVDSFKFDQTLEKTLDPDIIINTAILFVILVGLCVSLFFSLRRYKRNKSQQEG